MANAWQVVPPWQIVPVCTGSLVAVATAKLGVPPPAQPRPVSVAAARMRQPWSPGV